MSNKHSENLFSFYWRCFCDLLIALVLRPFPFNMCTHPLSHTNARTHTPAQARTHARTCTRTHSLSHSSLHVRSSNAWTPSANIILTFHSFEAARVSPIFPPPLFYSSLFSRGNVFSLEIETEAEEDLLAFENEPDVINDRSVAGPGVREINNNNNNNNKINNKVIV